jgi:hypothetical protein
MAENLGFRSWTMDRQSAIDDAGKNLASAFAVARARLESVGVRRDADQGAFCFSCQCEGFLMRDPLGLTLGGGDHPFNPCLRAGCGHDFLKHYVY